MNRKMTTFRKNDYIYSVLQGQTTWKQTTRKHENKQHENNMKRARIWTNEVNKKETDVVMGGKVFQRRVIWKK